MKNYEKSYEYAQKSLQNINKEFQKYTNSHKKNE